MTTDMDRKKLFSDLERWESALLAWDRQIGHLDRVQNAAVAARHAVRVYRAEANKRTAFTLAVDAVTTFGNIIRFAQDEWRDARQHRRGGSSGRVAT